MTASARRPPVARSIPVVALACTTIAVSLAACSATPAASTVATAQPTPSTDASATALRSAVALVVERLETAPLVAASKLHSGQAVDDPARERVVLDAARAEAEQAGVDPDRVETVFADQIAANKVVQRSLLASWAHDPASAPSAAPDLATSVRPTLDRITPALVSRLAAAGTTADDRGCAADVRGAVAHTRIRDAAVRAALPAALAHLCPAGSTPSPMSTPTSDRHDG